MFEFFQKNKMNDSTVLSLSFYNDKEKKTYEVCYESCEFSEYARIKTLDKYSESSGIRFKRRIPNEKFDYLVGYAVRNGFFNLKSLYQGDVKDNYKYVLGLNIGGRTHVVTDSFGAAPFWVKNLERMMMNECIEN